MDWIDAVLRWLRACLPQGQPRPVTAPARRRQGDQAEALAAAHLRAQGARILARNYQCRAGEIDLIIQDGPVTAFIEVRLRQDQDHGGAAASITPAKQRRIRQAARHWLTGKPARPCRFDAVVLNRLEAEAVSWIRGAFDEC